MHLFVPHPLSRGMFCVLWTGALWTAWNLRGCLAQPSQTQTLNLKVTKLHNNAVQEIMIGLKMGRNTAMAWWYHCSCMLCRYTYYISLYWYDILLVCIRIVVLSKCLMISKQHSIMCPIFVNVSELDRISIWLYSVSGVSKHLNAGTVDFETETILAARPSHVWGGHHPAPQQAPPRSGPCNCWLWNCWRMSWDFTRFLLRWSSWWLIEVCMLPWYNDVNPVVEVTHGWCSPVLLHCWSFCSICVWLTCASSCE